jgi:hypothetical protein
MKQKSPWIAAALNLLLPGAGYIYAGMRVRFGVILIAAMVLVLFGPKPEYNQTVDTSVAVTDPSGIVVAVAGIMVSIGFAYDAYCDGKRGNDSYDQNRPINPESDA